jgi:hypothetical protein
MAPRVGPVHGVQPTAKTAPSSGAPASPAAGRQPARSSRWLPPAGSDAEEDQAHDHDERAADPGEGGLVPRESRPRRGNGERTEEEDDREAEDEQGGAEDDPGPAWCRRPGVGQSGDIAEEAWHEGEHAG